MRLRYFIIIEGNEVGIGFSTSWSHRDKIVQKYKSHGHIACMIRAHHPYAKWLKETVEYNETLDGKIIQYGIVFSGSAAAQEDLKNGRK